jgi:hypothetical protein
VLLGLTISQVISAIVFAGAVAAGLYLWYLAGKKPEPAEAASEPAGAERR